MSGHQNTSSAGDSGVGVDGVLNPPGEAAEVGVDARFVGLATGKVSPGYEALQGTIADHGPPGITLWRRKGGTESQRCKWREGDTRTEKGQGSKRDTEVEK